MLEKELDSGPQHRRHEEHEGFHVLREKALVIFVPFVARIFVAFVAWE